MKISRGIAVVIAVMTLAGCATSPTPAPLSTPQSLEESSPTPEPEPEPEPTKPAVDELALSPDGIADIVIGEPVPTADPQTAIAEWDGNRCIGQDQPDSDKPFSGSWVTTYDDLALEIHTAGGVKGGEVVQIASTSREVQSTEGIAAGDSRADLEAAYPDAKITANNGPVDVYRVSGANGHLEFEVSKKFENFWMTGEEQVDTVLLIKVVTLDAKSYSIYIGTGAYPCPS